MLTAGVCKNNTKLLVSSNRVKRSNVVKFQENINSSKCVIARIFNSNTLFFQSALCRQSAVETKSQNQGQSGTRQGQIGTRVGQIGTGEGQIGTGEGQLEVSYRVLETWFSSINEVSI